jgi:hypothetical protein
MHADAVYKLTTTTRRGPLRWQSIVCVARTGNPGSRQLSVSNAQVICKPHVVNVEFGIRSSYIASVTADNTTRPLPHHVSRVIIFHEETLPIPSYLMVHGFPLKPLKPWRERIRCVRVSQLPRSAVTLMMSRRGSTMQTLHLGLACSYYGDRDHICIAHQLSVWFRFRSATMARICDLRPQLHPLYLRVRVHDCEIPYVPRGAYPSRETAAEAYPIHVRFGV